MTWDKCEFPKSNGSRDIRRAVGPPFFVPPAPACYNTPAGGGPRITKTHLPPQPNDTAGLLAINDAALTIAAEPDLDKVLQKIVDLARELARARYAALGIPDPDGRLTQLIVSGLSDEQMARIETKPTGRGVLGLLLNQPQVLRLSDLRQHPVSVGFPRHHPQMGSFMGVPIAAQGRLVASLYLTDRIGEDQFTERDEWLIRGLAAHAAVAIENARRYERVRRMAVLEERERIGMDLHDGIIQSIYAVGLSLELARMVLKEENPDETLQHTTSAIKGLDNIIRDIRSYIMDLQPARIQDDPLGIALERLVRELRANTLVQVTLEVDGDVDDGLADNCRLALFHITQEALANVAKHARASTVNVRLGRLHDRVVLDVEDDGAGFDSDRIGGIPGHGLSNMAFRARSLGGNLTVSSTVGKGTHVRAVLPAQATSELPQMLVTFP